MNVNTESDDNDELFSMINDLKRHVKDSVDPVKKDTERIENSQEETQHHIKLLSEENKDLKN